MGAKSLKDLIVWQKADALSLLIHKITESFLAAERFRLGDQMRSASSSIPLNFAQGFGRGSPKDRASYEIAKGSGDEVKAQLKQAMDKGYVRNGTEVAALVDEVCTMLYALRRKILREDI
jgi:four helix bundle protein